MRKEVVFSIRELRHVAITCPHCGTDVVLDMAQYEPQNPPAVRGRTQFAPRACPACQTPYDTVMEALNDLQRGYRGLSKLDEAITFRTTTPVDAEKVKEL